MAVACVGLGLSDGDYTVQQKEKIFNLYMNFRMNALEYSEMSLEQFAPAFLRQWLDTYAKNQNAHQIINVPRLWKKVDCIVEHCRDNFNIEKLKNENFRRLASDLLLQPSILPISDICHLVELYIEIETPALLVWNESTNLIFNKNAKTILP